MLHERRIVRPGPPGVHASIQRYVDRLARLACQAIGVRGATIQWPAGTQLKIQGSFGVPGFYRAAINERIPITQERPTPSWHAYHEGERVVATELSSAPELAPWHHIIRRARLSSLIAIPLQADGVTVGTLCAYFYEDEELSVETVNHLESLAEGLAAAVFLTRTGPGTLSESHSHHLLRTVAHATNATEVLREVSEWLRRPLLVQVVGEPAPLLSGHYPGWQDDARSLLSVAHLHSGRAIRTDPHDAEPSPQPRSEAGPRFGTATRAGSPAPNRLLVKPILSDGAAIAYLGVPVDEGAPLSWEQSRILEDGCLALSIALQRESAVRETYRVFGYEQVDLVLQGALADDEARLRLRRLGIQPTDCYRVIAIRPLDSETHNPWRTPTVRCFDHMVAITRRQEVLVLTFGKQAPEQAIATVMGGAPVQAGISDHHRDLSRLPEAVHEAERCLSLLQAVDAGARSLSYADVGPYRLLLDALGSKPAVQEALQVLDPILQHDRENGTELLKTLQAYLDENGHLGRTAARLYVHTNTVRYRLQTIESKLQLDMQDLTHLMFLSCALFLHRLARA